MRVAQCRSIFELALPQPARLESRGWLRWAALLWVGLAVAATGKTIIQGREHFVYPVFAAASRHWWADQSLYAAYEGLDLYLYSPTMAVALSPLAVLPDRLGGIIWNLLSIGLLYWATRVLVRDVLPGRWSERREAVFLTLVWVNSLRGVWSGHSNALLLAGIIAGLSAVARGRWWRAALLLALPVYVKIWPLALVMLLGAVWRRQLIGRFCAAAGLLAAVPWLTRPWPTVLWQHQGWYLGLTRMAQTRRPALRDFWRAWEVLFGTADVRVMLAVQLLTAALVLGWCLWQVRRTRATRFRLTAIFCAWLGWQLLFGPGSERLTYLILAPAASWAVVESFAHQRLRSVSLSAWLTSGLLGTGAVERAILPYFPAAPIIMPLGALAFVVWLVAWHWKPLPKGTPAAQPDPAGEPTAPAEAAAACQDDPNRPVSLRFPGRTSRRRRAA